MDNYVITEEFPNLETYKGQLERLWETSHLKDKGFQEIEDYFFSNAILLPENAAVHDDPEALRLMLFRVRWDVGTNENINDPQTFSFPPPQHTKRNRGNIEGEPVFYASLNPQISMVESKIDEGSIGYCGRWTFTEDLKELSVSYIAFHSLNPQNLLSGIGPRLNTELRDQFLPKNQRIKEHLQYLFEFIHRLFCIEKEPYILSSWIAHRILYRYNLDCLIYPSYGTNFLGSNFAFNRHFVQKHMRLQEIFKFGEYKYVAGEVSWELLQHGTVNESGTIEWKDMDNESYDTIISWISSSAPSE